MNSYQNATAPGSLTATFSAGLENVERFCAEVRLMMDELGLGAHHFAVQLLLREALNNAVIHGCRKDQNKIVETTLRITDNTLTLEIADPGEGFKWQEQLTRASDDRADSGRGFGIFRAYATEFTYNEKGTSLFITLKLS